MKRGKMTATRKRYGAKFRAPSKRSAGRNRSTNRDRSFRGLE
jgi:hypothetical protein